MVLYVLSWFLRKTEARIRLEAQELRWRHTCEGDGAAVGGGWESHQTPWRGKGRVSTAVSARPSGSSVVSVSGVPGLRTMPGQPVGGQPWHEVLMDF